MNQSKTSTEYDKRWVCSQCSYKADYKEGKIFYCEFHWCLLKGLPILRKCLFETYRKWKGQK